MHVGIDNKAVVDRACRLRGLAQELCQTRDDDVAMRTRVGRAFEVARKLRRPEAKHWQLQKDGDVWHAIWRVILAKGPGAIKVSKVKGHATAEDIEEGKATAVDKAGNDVADSLVRNATALHGKGTVGLAYWLEGRHKAYCKMMGEIQQFIIHMLTLDKEERDRRRREANPFDRIVIPKVLLPSMLHYSTAVGQRRLDIKDLPTISHRFSGQQKALTYVHRFLRIVIILTVNVL